MSVSAWLRPIRDGGWSSVRTEEQQQARAWSCPGVRLPGQLGRLLSLPGSPLMLLRALGCFCPTQGQCGGGAAQGPRLLPGTLGNFPGCL